MLTCWRGAAGDLVWIRPAWPRERARGLFSFRRGGFSRGEFASLNVGDHVGDDTASVRANRQKCAEELGLPVERLVIAQQVHGTRVTVVTKQDAGSGVLQGMPPISQSDALVTAEPGMALVVMAADCVPLLFFDDVAGVVACAHSGWKGTVAHIAREVIHTMTSNYASRPENVSVWMGPSIRRCCYEVGVDVARPITDEFGARHALRRWDKSDKFWVDLPSCIRRDLVDTGISPSQIHDAGVCTACRTDVLFSHRAESGRTGRLLGAAYLVPSTEGVR